MPAPKTSSLVMDVKVGDSVSVNGRVKISVEEKSGQRARLRFDHDGTADVQRVEQPTVASAAARGVSWAAVK